MTTTNEDEGAFGPDEVARLRLALVRLARRLRQQAGGTITPSQLSALSTIGRVGPLALNELAEAENVQPPSISRIVGSLEGEGLIERTIDPQDRRVALIRCTRRGRRLLARIRDEREAWLAQRVGELTPLEQERLLDALPLLERLREEP